MLNLKQCLTTAVKNKEIDEVDAKRIAREYDRARARAAAEGGEAMADAEAKRQIAALLQAETDHAKRKAKLGLSTIRRIAQDLDGFRTAKGEKDIAAAAVYLLEHNGEAKFASVAGRQNEITGMVHAMMENLLHTFRRSAVLGDIKRMNAAQLPNVVRELFGEESGDVAAKGLAQSFSQSAEYLRQRFNAAGGAIGKLEKWGLPQRHDPRALRNAGREQWVAAIKPMLDTRRMTHPLTGTPVTQGELDDVLGDIWRSVVTDGWDDRDPVRQAFGKGPLANQHAEHRFLVFKDADTWLAYQRDYGGGGDPIAAMMGHVNRMAKDIAAMEVLGPNPQSTIEWLKQAVTKEGNLHLAGEKSRFAGKREKAIDRVAGTVNKIDAIWSSIRGTLNTPVNGTWAAIAAGTRSFITSSVLGGAALSSLSDIGTSAITRAFAGIGGNPAVDIVKGFLPSTRREAVAAGLILDNAVHVFNHQARYVGTLGGPEWMSYLGDRVLTLSGLTPWTQSARHAFGLAFMHELTRQRGKKWDDIAPAFLDQLKRGGLTERDWDTLNLAQLHQMGNGVEILRPAEIATHNPKLAERYLGMVQTLTEFAVPNGGHRSRTLLLDKSRPGTVPGEIMRSFSQFKSFGAVYVMLHGGEIARRLNKHGAGNAAAYAGSLLIGSMIFGGLSMQLKAIAAGRDPQDMRNPKFWAAAVMQGGGIGIYGDFLFADVNRYGGGLAGTVAGPMVERLNDFRELTLGNMAQFANGDDTKFGRELVQFARSNIPGGNIWYTRLAWERLVLDQVQYLVDPEANAAFKRRQDSYAKDFGQQFWWAPGKASPQRVPAIPAALGR